MAKVIEVYIESVSHTPDTPHVHIHYHGLNVTTGPMAVSNMFGLTQDDLAARSPAKMRDAAGDDYWSDKECKAALADHLAESGINVVIVPNPNAARFAEETVTRRGKLSRSKKRN